MERVASGDACAAGGRALPMPPLTRPHPLAYYANVPTRNVVLTDHHEALIETLVGSGRYQNASEVLREGLRLIEQREAEDAAKLAALREAARIGMASIEAGRFKEFTNPGDLRRYLKKKAAKVLRDAKRR
jgi:antitoxin ParD1/3/4